MRVPLTTVGGEQAVFRMPPVIIIKQTMRRHTYLYLTVLPLLLLAAGCTKLQTEPTIQEGIYGSVIERYGDWMPTIGQYPKGGERPIKREVYVYEYTKMSDVKSFGYVHFDMDTMPTALVARTQSSKNGFFEIALPAGTYSVFIEDEGKLYCSSGDGQGGLNPITVKSGEAHEVTLVLDHAVY